jgi:hypothetical protein
MALVSTQPLVKMSTRNIPGGKGGWYVRLTSPLLRTECHGIQEPKPPGTLWATAGLLRDYFTFTFTLFFTIVNFYVPFFKLFFFLYLLTAHLDAILGNDQLDALFLNVFIYASTCFEQQVLIIRRAKLY